MIYIYFDKIDRKIKLQNLLNEFFFQEIRTVKNKIDIHPFRFKFYTCSMPTLLTNILLALDRAFPQKKKKIYIYFSVSSERSRGWGDREVRWRKRERKRGSRRQSGIFRRWQRLRSHPSPSFRPRYFPALFLIYEPSGDSSFRSLINEGPDWIRDCNSGKFSGREITPHPRPVCTNKGTQGSVVPLSHSNAMIKKS